MMTALLTSMKSTQEMTTAVGLPAYEISNHATVGQECRHNLTYWQTADWIGVGPEHMVALQFMSLRKDVFPAPQP